MTSPSPISNIPSSSPRSGDDDVLVRVEGVSKRFCRDLKKSLWYGVKDIASEILPFGRRAMSEDRRSKLEDWDAENTPSSISHLQSPSPSLRDGEFWAVNDVSFELRRGECLGLIGRNGAGKTTLLKMLNGLIKPDHGSITMRGRIGALIALGAGFNPILTGRENIYVNGTILGLTRQEIDSRFKEIVDFAEIGEFIDSPVRSYSSGMQVRLGFAVASTLRPDVLLLDEVLAVGDAAFRNKCYNKIGDIRERAAIIFVSHNTDQIATICDRAIVLSRGSTEFLGDAPEGIRTYERLLAASGDDDSGAFHNVIPPLRRVEIDPPVISASYGETPRLRIRVESESPVPDAVIRVILYNTRHTPFAEWNSRRNGLTFDIPSGTTYFSVPVGPLLLRSGAYKLGVNINDRGGVKMLCWSLKMHTIQVDGPINTGPDVAFFSSFDRPD